MDDDIIPNNMSIMSIMSIYLYNILDRFGWYPRIFINQQTGRSLAATAHVLSIIQFETRQIKSQLNPSIKIPIGIYSIYPHDIP